MLKKILALLLVVLGLIALDIYIMVLFQLDPTAYTTMGITTITNLIIYGMVLHYIRKKKED